MMRGCMRARLPACQRLDTLPNTRRGRPALLFLDTTSLCQAVLHASVATADCKPQPNLQFASFTLRAVRPFRNKPVAFPSNAPLSRSSISCAISMNSLAAAAPLEGLALAKSPIAAPSLALAVALAPALALQRAVETPFLMLYTHLFPRCTNIAVGSGDHTLHANLSTRPQTCRILRG